jgi:DNA polymerase-3 subunit epsilon
MVDFITLDFETAQGKRNSICAIGFVCIINNVITEKYWSLLKPPNKEYSPYNIKIHRIKPRMTENAPAFETL